MISVFVEAALRSLLAGFAVAIGLRIFRVRNVLAQKAAWGLVLVSALAMPLLLPVSAQWRFLPAKVNIVLPAQPMTLLEELQARIVAKPGPGVKVAAPAVPVPQNAPAASDASPAPESAAKTEAAAAPARIERAHRSAKPERAAPFVPGASTSPSSQPVAYSAGPTLQMQSPAQGWGARVSPIQLAFVLYCAIAAFLFLRIALGLLTTIRLWRTATPVPAIELPHEAGSLRIRASHRISSPLNIGSAILLPANFKDWDSGKLRIVLAHERSHIRQGDFYLQLLAGLYAAVVWFSPLGWWLKHELADLAEAISDRAGMEEAANCASYAQILLEFAAESHRVSLGVAMARPGSLSRRIERLLNDNSFRQCFAGGRRALVSVVLVPVALIASITLVRVEAAAAKQFPSPAPAAAPASRAALAFLGSPQRDTPQSAPAIEATPDGDEELTQLPAAPVVEPAVLPKPAAPEPEPASEWIAMASPAPPTISVKAPAVAMIGRGMQEGDAFSFDRTLSVSGAAQLMVSTGSGDIQITRGSESQIHIHGHIHVHREGSKEQAQQIAANPPIEQSGDTIHVGQHQEQWRGISIDYQIEAPAGTLLGAISGSGNIVDDGVGKNAKLETGSGDIKATGLEGPFTVKTGSGNITATQTGQGDVVADTGSGDVEIKDIHGGFHGQTGSGDIKASGAPSASWVLQTGSGNIELWTGSAPLSLDASTGSGSVSTDHEMVVQGTFNRNHIHGNLNGGGPTVRVETGSGDVKIH